jgi:S1-C subfamily serine protease
MRRCARRLWCGSLLVAALASCSVTPPAPTTDKDLVAADDPIFDRRFEDIDPAQLELSRFWREPEPRPDDAPIPLTNRTVSDLVARAAGGVVNIYTLTLEEREALFGISPNELLPIRIPIVSTVIDVIPWKVPIPFRTEGLSLGSGFIINDQGYVLTNAHVIHNARDIRVVVAGVDREFPARIIGKDPVTDVALIRIDPTPDLTVLPLGDSDRVAVGELVMAVGNPFGLQHTVTSGLVSAKERVVPTPEASFLDFLQTDSAINPGSSGGPLLNLHGEVVGVNTAIASGGEGIGFAIPVNTVKQVMRLLVLGRAQRGWLGVAVRPLAPGEGAQHGIVRDDGAFVEEVVADGPADQAGLRADDVIVRVGGREVQSFVGFRRSMLGLLPGETVGLTVLRGGETIEVTSRLATNPDAE